MLSINMIFVICLFTDILITYVYDVAFRDGAYGVAAAWSVVIFLMLVVFSWTYMKKTNATEAVT